MNINKRTWKAFCRHRCRHFNNFMLNAQFTFYVRHKYFCLLTFFSLSDAASALNLSYSLPHISYMYAKSERDERGGGEEKSFVLRFWIHRVSSVFMHNPKLNKEEKFFNKKIWNFSSSFFNSPPPPLLSCDSFLPWVAWKKNFSSEHNKRDNNGCSENCLLDLFKHENYQQRGEGGGGGGLEKTKSISLNYLPLSFFSVCLACYLDLW
jgi:hypothetical protein